LLNRRKAQGGVGHRRAFSTHSETISAQLPETGTCPGFYSRPKNQVGQARLGGAALKSAISSSLVVEYALHVLPSRSYNWRDFRCGAANR
jgi:hypothetical protein